MAAVRIVAGSCVAAVFVSACSVAAAGGDPGQRRLHELAAEEVFRLTPPGSARPGPVVPTPAHKRPAGFGSGGWEGPSVISSFTAATPPGQVLRFYDENAVATGWHRTASGAFGVPDRWAKTYPDGTSASLVLNVAPRQTGWSYQLAASAPAKT